MMIDIQIRDLTKAPNEKGHLDWIVLTNPQWEQVKVFIEQLKEQNK